MLTIRTLCAQFFCKPETAQQSVCGQQCRVWPGPNGGPEGEAFTEAHGQAS